MASALALSQLETKPQLKARVKLTALLLTAAFLVVWAFSRLPVGRGDLAIDWKVFWFATQNFSANYSGYLVFSPPWTLVLLWPLTWIPLQLGWGISAFLTLLVLVLAASHEGAGIRNLIAILLLCTSYPAVRQLVDGNLEAIVIGGVLLILWAAAHRSAWVFALGMLLAASKIQASWLLLAFAALWIWRNWPRREFWRAAAFVAIPVVATLAWRGADWLEALGRFPFRGTPLDASLLATGARLGVPIIAIGLVMLAVLVGTAWALRKNDWRLGRLQAGLLVSVSLLLAPYAASNSVLTPLALGATTLYTRKPWLGLFFFFFANVMYLFVGDAIWRQFYEATYWAAVLLLLWVSLAWETTKSPS